MLFNSLDFVLFFPIICIIFWGVRSIFGGIKTIRVRNIILLIASYYFYMCWQPKYALILLCSTIITYLGASIISRGIQRKVVLVAAISLNLFVLFFFKYFNFVAEIITTSLSTLNIKIEITGFDILLPVGISFYIFQALGYLIDVYRGETKAEKDFITYSLFVSFFPQLVAGPIERSKNLLKQFHEDRPFNEEFAISGFKLMLWGYFLKLCVADRCGLYVDPVFNNLDNHEGMSTLIAAVLFSFQIYGDFAGYTFIAIGCSRILGYNLNENFRRPYFSTSITEFWHRWHISLSSWLRDYVYIPLGGSRTTKAKTYRNIIITFLVSGIWHGANWTFIIWGAIHGIIQCIERFIGWHKQQWKGIKRVFIIGFTFLITTLAWVLFRANDLSDAYAALNLVFDANDFSLATNKSTLLFLSLPLVIVVIKEMMEERRIRVSFIEAHPMFSNYIWCSSLMILIGCFGVFEGGKFIYFQF